MLAAVAPPRPAGAAAAVRWLGVTAVLGAVFAALHLREWFNLFAEGWSPSTNPIGGPVLFGGTFFGITGLHLLHVLVWGGRHLGRRRWPSSAGGWTPSHVETTGLYWHFVDLVWMFVFPLVYLMNAR